jgi:hypothetical protein
MTRHPAGHETHDAPPMVGVLGMSIIAAILVVALGLVALLLIAFKTANPERAPYPQPLRQQPLLETQPGQALAAVRARIPAETTTYGWADSALDLAHIPVDRAMQITVQRGWSDAPSGAKP